MNRLVDEIISKHNVNSIEDVVNLIPKYMCHITQESDVFSTYNPIIMKMAYPESEWKKYEDIYNEYSDVIIPSITLEQYLERFLLGGERLPCFCSEIGDVVGSILSRLLNQPVYVIRRTFVSYLSQPTRRHCLNAIVENDSIRYIDAAVYNQVLDKKSRKFVHPHNLDNFDPSNIKASYVEADDWLHSLPFKRRIYVQDGVIKDNFYPNPDEDGLVDEYLHVHV